MGDFFDSIKDRANEAKDNLLDKLGLLRGEWPQTMTQPPFNVKGFLPPQLISPSLKLNSKKDSDRKANKEGEDQGDDVVEKKEPGGYTYTDWMGYKITDGSEYKSYKPMSTKDKFSLGINLPKDKELLKKEPYSTRDTLILYNDATQDYFKYGLQTINNLNNDFPTTQPVKKGEGSTARLYNFMNNVKTTPYENNDPVMFGFEIIIDAVSSPLLNGSVYDFLDQFSTNSQEIKARYEVYEDFKNQFKKIFKTRGTVNVNESFTRMTNLGSNSATVESSQQFFNAGRRAYMAYFLKKIEGLNNLAEKNSPGTKKYLTDYGKDVIKLEFYEDVSLSLGTLAHLYKLLYWSKALGKTMIPENLLRFNCEIIVSECRNFNRTRKALETGNLEIIKDNVSRYIYSLRECQFYFDAYTHPDSIDNSNTTTTESYTVQFDFKYSAMKFERWTPGPDNFGKYVGYHNGALWKVGNVGNKGSTYSVPVPKFLTLGGNTLFQNGVTKPMVLQNNFKVTGKADELINPQEPNYPEQTLSEKAKDRLKDFKDSSLEKAKGLAKQSGNRLIAAATREAQTFINKKVALLNKSINKILDGIGIDGMTAPRNIYTDKSLDLKGRLFYDVRGEMLNFAGGMLGNKMMGQASSGTIVVPPRPSKPNPLSEQNLSQQRSYSFANTKGDTVRYDQSAQQNYGTSNFSLIQFPFYAQRWPSPITSNNRRPR